MNRRNFPPNSFAFIPLALGFLGISKMGLNFLAPRRKSLFRKIFTTTIDILSLNESKEMADLKGKKFTLVRAKERHIKPSPQPALLLCGTGEATGKLRQMSLGAGSPPTGNIQ